MVRSSEASGAAEEALRQEGAAWFARMHGPQAARHRPEFEAWLKADPRRQATYDRLERRWEEAAVLVGAHPRLKIGRAGESRLRSFTLPRLFGVAFACALGLLFSPVRPALLDQLGLPSPWWVRVRTEVGQVRQVRLADGSSLVVDTDSLVLTRLTGDGRSARLLRGRARFDVAADPARPFLVRAGDADISARAGLFDVAYVEPGEVSTMALKGAVDIRAAGSIVRVAPGQAWTQRGRASRLQGAAAGGALWPSGILSFSQTPLAEALAEANRYSRQHVVLSDTTLGRLQVSGVFRAGAPRALADGLAAAFDLRVEDRPDGDLGLARPSAASPIETAR